MTTTTPVAAPVPPQERTLTRAERRAIAAKTKLSSPAASVIAMLIAALWTVPTLGLFVTSFRPELEIRRSGWWTALTDPQFTVDNYNEVLYGGGAHLAALFFHSLVIPPPPGLLPLPHALLAPPAVAWV